VVAKQSKWIVSALLIANLPQVKLTPQSGSMLTKILKNHAEAFSGILIAPLKRSRNLQSIGE